MTTNFFSPDISQSFHAAVKAANGKVVILVHPYYDPFLLDARFDYQKRVNAVLQKSKIPVIILEEKANIDAGRTKHYTDNHYLVPTKPQDPTPVNGWDELHTALQAAGAKIILIGGMYAGHGASGLWNSNTHELSQKLRDICAHDARLPRRPKKSILFGCVSETYHDFISTAAKQNSTYEKIRLMPQVLAPNKLKYAKPRK